VYVAVLGDFVTEPLVADVFNVYCFGFALQIAPSQVESVIQEAVSCLFANSRALLKR
jgi:hypothetical protein